MKQILAVSSDELVFNKMNQYLSKHEDVTVTSIHTGDEALKKIKDTSFDLVIAEETLSDMGGVDFVKKCIAINFMINCVLTGSKTPEKFHEDTEGLGVLMQLPASPNREDVEQLLKYLDKIQKDVINQKK